jgi:WD40 repeat protein
MARVFVSHSSRDAGSARWIADWLVAQGFDAPFLDFDKHSGIPPGANWEQTLYQAIQRSQALLIVQSDNWNASKWCFAEFTQARALGKPIFQLVGVPPDLTDSPDQAPISVDLQQLNLRQDREAALDSLAKALHDLALNNHGGFAWDSHRAPYPGLLSFDAEDAAVFFGREPELRELIERLEMLRIQGGGRLLVLLGASGAGKSSLIRAGALPRLARCGNTWLPLAPFRPQADPCLSLATSLAHGLRDGRSPDQIQQLLVEAESSGCLASLLSTLVAALRNAHQAPDAAILLSLDQGEELFSLAAPQPLRRFFSILNAALQPSSGILALITLRSDYIGQLQAVEGLNVPLIGMPLSPMPRERIADIIKGPAQVAGLLVEESFVQAAIADAATADALPLLAFALRELYDRFAADGSLTLSDYQQLGDQWLSPLENSVKQAAEKVIAIAAPSEEQIEALREAFISAMVGLNEQGDYVRKPARWDALPPLAEPLLMRLVQARLLTVEQRHDQRWLEVVHEALLRSWPLLRRWLDDARDILVGTRHLEGDLHVWKEAEEQLKDAALLSGLKLTQAQAWLQQQPQHFSAPLKRYVEASMARRDLLSRRRQRMQLAILLGLASLAILTTGAWGWGLWERMAAYEAETRLLQRTHLLLVNSDPKRSIFDGLVAMYRLQNSIPDALPSALSLDRATSNNTLKALIPSHQHEVWSLAAFPDGRIISGAREGTVRFFSPKGLALGDAITTAHGKGVRGLVAIDHHRWWSAGKDGTLQRWTDRQMTGKPIVSGHGSIQVMVRDRQGNLITGGMDGNLRRWSSEDGTALGAPIVTGHQEVWSMAVLSNGDWVTGGREGGLRWWHAGKPSGTLLASGQGVVTALLGLAHNAVLTGGADGSVGIRNASRQLGESIRSGHASVQALLRAPNGLILSGGTESYELLGSNYIRFWDPRHHKAWQSLRLAKVQHLSVVETCNGDLISGTLDGFLYHWRDSRPIGRPIQTGHGPVFALVRTRKGDIVSGGRDGTVKLWQNGQLARVFSTGQKGVFSLLTLPDGTLLSGGGDGTIRHWYEDGRQVRAPLIRTSHGKVWTMAQLSNGDLLTGGDDGMLLRWRNGKAVASYSTPHNLVASLIIRRTGDWVTGGGSGEIQFWRQAKPIGPLIMTGFGGLWTLIERRDGHLVSANGDGSIITYPTPQEAIDRGCSALHGLLGKARIDVIKTIKQQFKDVKILCDSTSLSTLN